MESSEHVRDTVSLTLSGQRSLLLSSGQESLRVWISIFPEFILHAESALKSWFCDFPTSCLRQLKIPDIWRRELIVVIPKPEKPLGYPKCYRPISLLCIPFKILEKLIYAHVEPVVDFSIREVDHYIRSPCWHRTSKIAFRLKRSRSCVCRLHSSRWHPMAPRPHLQAAVIAAWQTHGPHDHGDGWQS